MRVLFVRLILMLFITLGFVGCGDSSNSGDSTADTVPPVISVIGKKSISVVQGAVYTDAGATATDNVDGTVSVSSTGVVNTTKVGAYTITYTAKDAAGNVATAKRTVNVTATTPPPVVDTTAPVITLLGNNPLSVVQGTAYTDAGATATDDVDGAVSVISSGAVDTTTVGVYAITYTAKDAAGNVATATRTVNVTATTPPPVVDTMAPVITVLGVNPLSVVQGTAYTDAGATAQDDVDGTVSVTSSGTVNTAKLGVYEIIYTARDAAGNVATAKRVVTVVAAPVVDTTPPVITVLGDNPASVVQGSVYVDAGARAIDDVNGILLNLETTGTVDTSTVGTYTIRYSAYDAAGNRGFAERVVNVVASAVVDMTAPVITLLGDNPVAVVKDAVYTDAGATAKDDVDGTVSVTSSGTVDTTTVGVYAITYTAKDAAGNVATAKRTVNVVAVGARVTLSGTAFDAAIVGGTVTVKDLTGNVLGTAVTDADGKFTLDVSEGSLVNGYTLTVAGGTMDGAAFTGELTATYSNADPKDALNLTAITSLIDAIAVDMPGVTLLDKRNAVIQRLVTLGMIQSSDWNLLTSDYFDLQSLALRIQDAGGVQAWLDLMKIDFSDGELSALETTAFPKAYGGLLVFVQDETSVFPGEQSIVTVSVEPVAAAGAAVLKLLDAPSWVTVAGNTVIVAPPIGEAPAIHTVNIEVSPGGVAVGRKAQVNISVLKQVTLLHGFIGSAGGKIENEWRDIALAASVDALPQEYEFTYFAGINAQEEMIISLRTNPEITDDLLEKIVIVKPSDDVIRANYLGDAQITAPQALARAAQRTAMAAATRLSIPSSMPEVCKKEAEKLKDTAGSGGVSPRKATAIVLSNSLYAGFPDGFVMDQAWAGWVGSFDKKVSPVVNNGNIRLLPYRTPKDSVSLCASMLSSNISIDSAWDASAEPVLFVNGFESDGGLTSVDDYFVKFPKIVNDLQVGGRKFVPFFFRWNTTSRFEDAANELGQAIKIINSETNKQVHIVAHSFGGILTRTLLQKLAEKPIPPPPVCPSGQTCLMAAEPETTTTPNLDYTDEFLQNAIASVTTVGSPHSGIFGEDVNVRFDGKSEITFYSGVDNLPGWGTSLCKALTCHELGRTLMAESQYVEEAAIANAFYAKAVFYYGIKRSPGQIAFRLADGFLREQYPEIPTQILIGIIPDLQKCEAISGSATDGQCKVETTAKSESTGDGLISLHGQRIIPLLGDGKQVDDMYKSSYVEEYLLGFNGDSNYFERGGQDHYVSSFNSGSPFITGQLDYSYVTRYKKIPETGQYYPYRHYSFLVDDKFLGYNHRGGQHKPFVNSGNGTSILYAENSALSEVGLQNCTSPDNCNHATWNYFKSMVELYPAKNLITLKVDIKGDLVDCRAPRICNWNTAQRGATREIGDALEGYTIKIFIDGEQIGAAVTDTTGSFAMDAEFKPNRTYVLEVYPPVSSDSSISPRATIVRRDSADTIEESDFNFSGIELIDNTPTPQQGELGVQLKDGSTGAVLLGYNLTVSNDSNTLVDMPVNMAEDSIITLPEGPYTVTVSKSGYSGAGKALCTVRQLQSNPCVVTLLPDGYVTNGGLSAVLTWGATPRDLDSHLLKYGASGNLLCHTFHADKPACGIEGTLDLDNTRGYGPETVTMQQIDTAANYIYAIHNFSGEGSITGTSQAKVTVALADGSSRTFNAPTSGTGRYWKVFEIRGGRLLPCQSNCMADALPTPSSAARSATSGMVVTPNWKLDIERSIVPKY